MRRSAAALLFVSLVTLTNREAAAQPSAKDVAAANAIASTPAGTFTPLILNEGWDANGKFGLAGRYGMMSPKTGESNNSLGVTGSMGAGTNAIVSGTLGYTLVGCPSGATCDNGIQLGGDILSSLWSSKTNAMHLKFQGSLGWSSFGDVSTMSAVVGVPLVWDLSAGRSASSAMQASSGGGGRFAIFANPAFGWGRMSMDIAGTSTSESGTRPLVSAGLQYNTAGGMGFHAGYTRVIIEDAGNIFGVGMTYNVGTPRK
jgi:hypothetical protein